MRARRVVEIVRHPRRVFYGWWMALAGTGMVAYTDGAGFYGFSAFFKAMLDEFKWSQAVAAVAPSLQRLESGVLTPLAGYLVDRLGPRRVLLFGFATSGACFLLLSRVHSLWQYYAVFLIMAVGLSTGSFMVATAAVSNWFRRYRGRAISIVMLGPGLSGLLAGLWVWVISAYGWRTALVIAGLGFWLICIPLAMMVRGSPEQYGSQPDGDRKDAPSATESGRRRPESAEATYPMRTILRSRGYWQYVLSAAFSGASWAVITFAVPSLRSFGLSAGVTGLVLVWLTVSSVPARLISGYLADVYDKRVIMAGSILLQLAGVLLFAATTSALTAFLAAFLLGSSIGSGTTPRLALQAEYWGRSVFGRLAGIQMGLSSLPGILAPVFVGWMFDTTGSYRLAFVLISLPLALAIPTVLTIQRPREAPTPVPTS